MAQAEADSNSAIQRGSAVSENMAVTVRDLFKTYRSKKAINGISFSVQRGDIFGILGPNGAGKTTTLEIIEGLREPDNHHSTQILVGGFDVRNRKQREELHQHIGLQLQSSALFEELTVLETLTMLARLYRNSRSVSELLTEFKLEQKTGARINTLSGGQKQRLSLAAALVNNPSLLFLDEPTTALDPHARRSMWEQVRGLQQAGKTIILTTHYMEEAELLCDQLAIMDAGRIIAQGTPAGLINQYATEQSITCRLPTAQAHSTMLEVVKQLPGIGKVESTARSFTVSTTNLAHTLSMLLQAAAHYQIQLTEITTHNPGLENVYLNLTGNTLSNQQEDKK
ncbi:ABC transporter ATP-binding protein [Dictyobacter alpinus]|uniref:ABC transporter ATP-binding protein n=1 Tax=Dictyobacter alpinus TaxID=2014873 RepID=A0A402B1U6_9CHLR|nr:ABC transporter ATP-binding protein [Dictyobacter alpinus]GCE25277.1 ABC transporter ATP-binding protein [Dictyobacter alpinus]